MFIGRYLLLARHNLAHLGFGILEQLAADIHRHAVDRDGELEQRGNAKFFLVSKDHLAVGVPAVIELALVLVGPLFGDVMRSVHGSRAEVHEERFVGRHLLGFSNKTDGFVYQVFRQVIAFFRCFFLLDNVVVVDQFRVILLRVATIV